MSNVDMVSTHMTAERISVPLSERNKLVSLGQWYENALPSLKKCLETDPTSAGPGVQGPLSCEREN